LEFVQMLSIHFSESFLKLTKLNKFHKLWNQKISTVLKTGLNQSCFCFRGFKLTGPTVIMIYRMMAADLLRFVAIYFIFVMGFAQGML
jgi:hypothetical protein